MRRCAHCCNRAAVSLDDCFGQGQAQAAAGNAPRTLAPVQFVPDTGQLLLWDSRTRVGDLNDDEISILGGPYFNRVSGPGELVRVVQQVVGRKEEEIPVAHDLGEGRLAECFARAMVHDDGSMLPLEAGESLRRCCPEREAGLVAVEEAIRGRGAAHRCWHMFADAIYDKNAGQLEHGLETCLAMLRDFDRKWRTPLGDRAIPEPSR